MIRVAIQADSALARAGLESLLERDGRFVIIAEPPALDRAAQDRSTATDPTVVVVVLDGPRVPTFSGNDGVPTVFIIDSLDAALTARLYRAGARAVLPREATAEQIDAAIAAAAAGLTTMPADVARSGFARGPEPAEIQPLTPREAEVLNHIAGGLGNKVIAVRLGISEHTVKSHVEAIFEKLHVGSRAEAVARGAQLGLVLI